MGSYAGLQIVGLACVHTCALLCVRAERLTWPGLSVSSAAAKLG